MKLGRVQKEGRVIPIVLDEGSRCRDLIGLIDDIDINFIQNPELGSKVADVDPSTLPLVEAPYGVLAPLCGTRKMLCAGLNYRAHAAEAGMSLPAEPEFFIKPASAICGPSDPCLRPPGAEKLDWEVELAVVIGKPTKNVTADDAMSSVFGYLLTNDVSERSYQLERGSQWLKGKSYDSFGPIGPWLVTATSIGDPHALDIWLRVNGVEQQRTNTSDMHFSIPELISTMSRYMTLETGDIIATGTPAGVAFGNPDAKFLEPGDVIELGCSVLGTQTHTVVDDSHRRDGA